jgi:ribonuclease P protein component
LLDIRLLDSPTGTARAAVVVALYGNSAVDRNTLKRRLRELVRVRMLPRIGPKDVLVRARRETYTATFEQLAAAVEAATDRISQAANENT